MATKFLFKRSSTASAVPALGDLVAGEAAINLADKAMYIRDASNNILRLGLIEGTPTVNLSARYDGTKWVPSTGFSISATGTITAANVNTGGDVTATGTVTGASLVGDGAAVTNVDAATLDGLTAAEVGEVQNPADITTPKARLDDAWVDTFEVIDTDTVKTQPTKIEVLTATEYGLITPDADTLYLITLT